MVQLCGVPNSLYCGRVRLRILKQTSGILDSVSLSNLLPGLTYEVPISLGTFLMAQGSAEEDMSRTLAIVIPLAEAPAAMTGGVTVSPPVDQADAKRRKESGRRRRQTKKR